MKDFIKNYYTKLYEGTRGPQITDLPILRGKSLAAELGYPAGLIEAIPSELWDDFLPCGNVLQHVKPGTGDWVLNLGCGAGVDSIALLITGPADFQVVSLDAVISVLGKASRVAGKSFKDSRHAFICADGGELPFVAGSFGWVVLNGVFNLFPEKGELTGELRRVLKRGGTVAGADLCSRVALPEYFSSERDAWAWCMSGALSKGELSAAFESDGFRQIALSSQKIDEFFDRTLFAFEKID
ncbi:MAG: methyltransferase domain-containing protein [Syntrophobacteraceae bacterium]